MSTRNSKSKGKASIGDAAGPNIYVGLLVVSLSALLAGIIFLVLELQTYNWELGG